MHGQRDGHRAGHRLTGAAHRWCPDYDGSDHAPARQRSKDEARREEMRGAGLEVVVLTAPDLTDGRERTISRLRGAWSTVARRSSPSPHWRLL